MWHVQKVWPKVNRPISRDLGKSENATTFQFILELFKKALNLQLMYLSVYPSISVSQFSIDLLWFDDE